MIRNVKEISVENNPLFFELVADFTLAVNISCLLVDMKQSPLEKTFNFEQLNLSAAGKMQLNHQLTEVFSLINQGAVRSFYYFDQLIFAPLPLYIKNSLEGFIVFVKENLTSQANFNLDEYAEKIELEENRLIRIIDLFMTFSKVYADKRTAGEKVEVGYLYELEEQNEALSEKAEINKAKLYIKNNLHQPITLEEVASHVYLSQYYFSKLFKKELAMNFSAYLNLQRIEKAKLLLTSTLLTVEEIGRRVGYSRPSYFCKIFRSITSVSPATYRRTNEYQRPELFCKAQSFA